MSLREDHLRLHEEKETLLKNITEMGDTIGSKLSMMLRRRGKDVIGQKR